MFIVVAAKPRFPIRSIFSFQLSEQKRRKKKAFEIYDCSVFFLEQKVIMSQAVALTLNARSIKT
jgi:hypothetical protein